MNRLGSFITFKGHACPFANRRPRTGALCLEPFPKSARVGRQLSVAVGLTGLDDTGHRMLVIDVEPNKLVHREPPVPVCHGAFKRARILPAARRLRFHSFCRLKKGRRRR